MKTPLLRDVEVRRIKIDGTNYVVSAGTTDALTSEYIDTAGYEGVTILLATGAGNADTAVLTMKVQQSEDSGGSPDGYSDLEGTSTTFTFTSATTQDSKQLAIDINRPTKRYLKVVTTRATANIEPIAMFVFLYGPQKLPVTQGTGAGQFLVAPELFVSPAEGTA